MPEIKVELPQKVLEKLAKLASRNMVATRVMAADVIAAYLNQLESKKDAPSQKRIDTAG